MKFSNRERPLHWNQLYFQNINQRPSQHLFTANYELIFSTGLFFELLNYNYMSEVNGNLYLRWKGWCINQHLVCFVVIYFFSPWYFRSPIISVYEKAKPSATLLKSVNNQQFSLSMYYLFPFRLIFYLTKVITLNGYDLE